jgi:CheY-like chemotaxis protein
MEMAMPLTLSDTRSILIVEDELLSARAMKKILEQNGFRVIHAPRADMVLQMIHEESDLIMVILDLMLPPSNTLSEGVNLARAINNNGFQLPLKFISAYTEQVNIGELESIDNFDGFHQKPLSPRDLLENVDNVMLKRCRKIL